MAINRTINLFGFEIKRKKKDEQKDALALKGASFIPPEEEESVDHVVGINGSYGYYLDLDDTHAKTDRDLILKYREIAQQAECDMAISDIINEAIVSDEESSPVDIDLDDLEQPERIKKIIREEFENVTRLLNFNWNGHDIFRKWYIDGRLFYHKIVDDKNLKKGIQELRLIDPTKIRKVREIEETVDPQTGAKLVQSVNEFFVYMDDTVFTANRALKISKDAITHVTSGVVDSTQKRVLSHLHKAIKTVNQLKLMEDSLVIYRVTRSPERRVFYIDVGNLPKNKAEEYMRSIIAKHRNKIVYDASTGDIKTDSHHMSMLEDFFLPRREGGRGTEVTTLPGGSNLSEIEDILYFQRKLYKSLNVPMNRLEQDHAFTLGRSTEITRDEIKFQKFISRLRKRFSTLFLDLLRTQLLLKSVVSEEEWDTIAQNINFDYMEDNHFTELKYAEILSDRIRLLNDIEPFVGKHYSDRWVKRNILRMSDDDIEAMKKEMEEEVKDNPPDDDDDADEYTRY